MADPLGGLLCEFARKGDALHDVVMMALLGKEWPPAQRSDRLRADEPPHNRATFKPAAAASCCCRSSKVRK
jgi:hypothetical protein